MRLKTILSSTLLVALLIPTTLGNGYAAEATKESIGKDAYILKTTANADGKNKISQALTFNFIKDPNYDKETLIVKSAGSIYSGYRAPNPNDYFSSNLLWGAKYDVALKVLGKDSANIVDYAPKNQTESFEVKNTVGYNIGGEIGIVFDKPFIGGDAGFDFSETINYKQENYRTTLSRHTDLKNVGWGVEAHKLFVNGYGPYARDAETTSIYGNEIFLASRQGSATAGNNFVAPTKMPVLSRATFNPEFISILTHRFDDKDKKTNIQVTYGRTVDQYGNAWNGFHWRGWNTPNFGRANLTATYEIDWAKHEVKFVSQQEKNDTPS